MEEVVWLDGPQDRRWDLSRYDVANFRGFRVASDDLMCNFQVFQDPQDLEVRLAGRK